MTRKLINALFALMLLLSPAAYAADADWLFTASGVAATSTSTSYDLGGPGMVSVRVFGVSGTATATVVI